MAVKKPLCSRCPALCLARMLLAQSQPPPPPSKLSASKDAADGADQHSHRKSHSPPLEFDFERIVVFFLDAADEMGDLAVAV